MIGPPLRQALSELAGMAAAFDVAGLGVGRLQMTLLGGDRLDVRLHTGPIPPEDAESVGFVVERESVAEFLRTVGDGLTATFGGNLPAGGIAMTSPTLPRSSNYPNSPTRAITRSDDCQVRLTFLGNVQGVDVRIFRRSPNEANDHESYLPTSAGLVIPLRQAREFLGMLAEILREVEA